MPETYIVWNITAIEALFKYQERKNDNDNDGATFAGGCITGHDAAVSIRGGFR